MPTPASSCAADTPPRGTHTAFVGPIGVGKTTLAEHYADRTGATFLRERFDPAANPFLHRFYGPKGVERFGMHTEMSFLVFRAAQAADIEDELSAGRDVVTDYCVEQAAVFARQTLTVDDYALYQQMSARLVDGTRAPDRLVCLDAELDVIMQRIAGRGRVDEQGVPRAYVAQLQAGYAAWRTAPPAPALWLDTTDLAIPTDAHARETALVTVAEAWGVRLPTHEVPAVALPILPLATSATGRLVSRAVTPRATRRQTGLAIR